MRLCLLLAFLAAAVGCRGEDAPEREPSALDRNTFPGEFGYVLIRGTDTLAVERFSREAGVTEGELLDVEEGTRVRYHMSVDEDERPERIELQLFEAGADEPTQRAVVEIRGDSLIALVREGGEERETRIQLPRGTFALLGTSIASLEQLLRRAHELRGDPDDDDDDEQVRIHIPTLLVGGSDDAEREAVERVSVTWIRADSVHMLLDRQNQFLGAVESNSRIRHGINPARNVRVERIP